MNERYSYYFGTINNGITDHRDAVVIHESVNDKMVRSMLLSRVLDTFFTDRSDMCMRMRKWLEKTHPEMML